jgi:hypothetical protein
MNKEGLDNNDAAKNPSIGITVPPTVNELKAKDEEITKSIGLKLDEPPVDQLSHGIV